MWGTWTKGPVGHFLGVNLRAKIYNNRGPMVTLMSIHFKSRHLFVFMSSWLPFAVFLGMESQFD